MSLANRVVAELKGDRVIWMIVALLVMFSVLSVYSSTGTLAFKVKGGNTEFYLIKQVGMLSFGLLMTYLCFLLHYMNYSKFAPFLLLAAIPLLIFTLAFAPEVNDARRWIQIPVIGLSFQTSDFARLALVIYVARAISVKQEYIKDFNSAFLPIIVPIIIICGLIAPADLSTSLILFTTCMLMMFIGRVDMRYILLLLFCGVVAFTLLIAIGQLIPNLVRTQTWISRVQDFLHNSDGGYQTQQAKIAIAKGGLFGVGPGNSTQRNFLPYPYADYIYSIIIEEYGLIGGFMVISLYVLLFFRGVKLVTKSPKTFGAILSMGICLNLVIQALANMAVSVHIVPVTGLNLPLISMGGTSLLFSCIQFGILLSVSKYIEKVS